MEAEPSESSKTDDQIEIIASHQRSHPAPAPNPPATAMSVLTFGILVCFGLLGFAGHNYRMSMVIQSYDAALLKHDDMCKSELKEMEGFYTSGMEQLKQKCKIISPTRSVQLQRENVSPENSDQKRLTDKPEAKAASRARSHSGDVKIEKMLPFFVPGSQYVAIGIALACFGGCAAYCCIRRRRSKQSQSSTQPLLIDSLARSRVNPRPRVVTNMRIPPRDYELQPTPMNF